MLPPQQPQPRAHAHGTLRCWWTSYKAKIWASASNAQLILVASVATVRHVYSTNRARTLTLMGTQAFDLNAPAAAISHTVTGTAQLSTKVLESAHALVIADGQGHNAKLLTAAMALWGSTARHAHLARSATALNGRITSN